MIPFEKGNRYEKIGELVNKYFSEQNYYKEAVILELRYLHEIFLIQIDEKSKIDIRESDESDDYIKHVINSIIALVNNNPNPTFIYDAIKKYEKVHNHDIVAVQYTVMEFIKEITTSSNIKFFNLHNFIHWGLTSQDVVNTVYVKMYSDYIKNRFSNILIEDFYKSFNNMFQQDFEMLGKTHGQTAVLMKNTHIHTVYFKRISKIMKDIDNVTISVKFGNGVIGNNSTQNLFNFDFKEISERTIHSYFDSTSIDVELDTFQNNYYPYINDVNYNLHKLCHVLKDLCVDFWLYSSIDYIKKDFEKDEHGSSAMPQKSNPIEFENAEGNLDLAIGILDMFMRKLNISRLQRDLTDLTVLRNIGLIFCYIEQAVYSMSKGFEKFKWNEENIFFDIIKSNGSHYKEYIQLREKMLENGMTYEEVKLMSGDDVRDYLKKLNLI